MATTKKKAVRKKTTAKKTPAQSAKKLIKKAVKTTKPVKKPSSKGKKVFAKKTSAKSTPKLKKAATPRKLTQKEKMLIEGIRSVKTMAIIVPPIPSNKDIVSIKPEPTDANILAEEKPNDDKSYNPRAMEKKWQEKWEADKLYRAVIDTTRPKHYALTMLPYPSGDLHIGHWFSMIPPDTRARYKRMQGYNVMFPMGFDGKTRQSKTVSTR